jgi:hypothetical protein
MSAIPAPPFDPWLSRKVAADVALAAHKRTRARFAAEQIAWGLYS